jgi:hypothetical protein
LTAKSISHLIRKYSDGNFFIINHFIGFGQTFLLPTPIHFIRKSLRATVTCSAIHTSFAARIGRRQLCATRREQLNRVPLSQSEKSAFLAAAGGKIYWKSASEWFSRLVGPTANCSRERWTMGLA